LTLDLSSLTGTSLELRSCYRNLDQGSSLAKLVYELAHASLVNLLNRLTISLTPDPSCAVHITSDIFHMISTTLYRHTLICSTKDLGSSLNIKQKQ